MHNESVLAKASLNRELISVVQRRKLCYFGHLMRHDSLQRDLLEGMIEGKRYKGRPRNQWSQNVREWTGLSFEKSKRETLHRRRWSCIARDPRTGDATPN